MDNENKLPPAFRKENNPPSAYRKRGDLYYRNLYARMIEKNKRREEAAKIPPTVF